MYEYFLYFVRVQLALIWCELVPLSVVVLYCCIITLLALRSKGFLPYKTPLHSLSAGLSLCYVLECVLIVPWYIVFTLLNLVIIPSSIVKDLEYTKKVFDCISEGLSIFTAWILVFAGVERCLAAIGSTMWKSGENKRWMYYRMVGGFCVTIFAVVGKNIHLAATHF